MSDTGDSQSSNEWALQTFNFKMECDALSEAVGFTKISGLEASRETVEMRTGDDPTGTTQVMPGRPKGATITCERPFRPDKKELLEWWNGAKANTIARQMITISMLDEAGNPVDIGVFRLAEAFPTSWKPSDLDAMGSGAAMETLTIQCQQVLLPGDTSGGE
ncbi:hypothetical protein FUAX_24380 [Fulvitalea axinellae]|uniref:Phage tail protein n=1 Tax=Fulvitalea axinellae TaxID=1182444 RepID=A0AAU9CLX6_9BACT|nr:hypothetical protein FUAX_24380 [Fulvitalea axinellae]